MSVVTLFTLLFCLVPYMWFIYAEKNKDKKTEKIFKDALKNKNISLSIQEQWSNNIIGIDESKNRLIYLNINSHETSFLSIDLSTLKSCQIDKQTRVFVKDKKNEIELQALNLELTFLADHEPVILNFYDCNVEYHEFYELERAEKWQTLIEKSMLNLSLLKIAA